MNHPYEVKLVCDALGLVFFDACCWLKAKGLNGYNATLRNKSINDEDYQPFHYHFIAGIQYDAFYFKDEELAIEFALVYAENVIL